MEETFNPDWLTREAAMRLAGREKHYPVSDSDRSEVWLETMIDAGVGDGYIGDPEASGLNFHDEPGE